MKLPNDIWSCFGNWSPPWDHEITWILAGLPKSPVRTWRLAENPENKDRFFCEDRMCEELLWYSNGYLWGFLGYPALNVKISIYSIPPLELPNYSQAPKKSKSASSIGLGTVEMIRVWFSWCCVDRKELSIFNWISENKQRNISETRTSFFLERNPIYSKMWLAYISCTCCDSMVSWLSIFEPISL